MSILYFIIFIFIFLIDIIETNYINDFSLEESSKEEKLLIGNYEPINYNNLENNFNQKNLFLSENRDKYDELNDFTDTSKKYRDLINNLSFAEIPENLISRYEDKYQLERRFKIIRSIEKKQNQNDNNQNIHNYNGYKDNNNNYYRNIEDDGDEYFSDKHNFYGDKKLLNFDYHYYWYFLFSKKSVINNIENSHIKDMISTDPEYISVKQKICFPITKLFSIYNPDTEDNLLIKDIKSDLYQVKIFPYLPEDYNGGKSELYSPINSYFPYNIFPQSKFVFQLLILPDLIGEVKGNLYIKFNDKNVLIIPITLTGIENEYKIKPIYSMNAPLYKLLSIPIKIINPDSKRILKIKDIIYSFNNNIRVELPNGIKIMNNISSINPSILHVDPNDSTNILHLKYFPNKVGNEYGFIYFKINDDNQIIIPIIINVEQYELNLFPLFINFGICEVKQHDRKNFIKVVPLLVLNYGNRDIEIKRVFIDYKDQFIHFHKITNKEDESDKIIVRKNSHKKFGYLIFDGEYYIAKDKSYYKGKIKEGTVYIETNSTINPILGIDYFYMTDYNHVIKIKSGYIQDVTNDESKDKFSVEMQYKPPKGFKSDFYLKTEKIEIYRDNFNSVKIYKKNQILNYNIELNINFDRSEKKYYYSPYLLNDRLYTIIPFEVNNNNIHIAVFKTKLNNFSFSSCINDKNICTLYTLKKNDLKAYNFYYFGSISGEINRKEYMYIINNNLNPFFINQIKTNNGDFTIDLENIFSINKDGTKEDYDLSYKGKLPNLVRLYSDQKESDNNENNKSNMNLILYPKTAMLLSINIKSKIVNETKTINGEIYFYVNGSSEFILMNQIRILIGDFSISPSNIKFGPGFLGITQSQQIFCTNTYEFTLNIISVTSSDSRLIPKLLTHKVKSGHKIAIMDIIFDPGVNSTIRRYKKELNMDKTLTFNEFYLWKKSEKYWNDLSLNGKTEINADISVVTHFKTKVINVRSFIKKPNLVKKEEIDYGLMQVGHLVEKYIEGHNPTDSVLEMKLLLAPDYYNNLDDYSMFDMKEQSELFLEENNVMTILGCNFVMRLNNTYQTFFEYILIKENIELENNFTKSISKEDVLRKIFENGNDKVKKYVYNSIDVLCNYEKKNKDEILLNKDIINEKFKKDIVSPEFNNEISIIKNMTYNTDYKSKHQQNNYNIFSRLFSRIKNYFSSKKEDLPKFQLYKAKQSFYLQENISQNIYRIQPHQNFTIGPIIFKPSYKGKVANTLFLKNNLTILYPIKLKGEGGSGQITFLNYYGETRDKKSELFNNNSNFIIDINRDTYENKMKYINNLTRTVTIYNSGNLPLIIKSITVDGNECQTDDLKVVQCREFLIDVGETMEIDFEVNTNFNSKITNRIVKFQSEFQVFELNVIIILSQDLYNQKEQTYKFWKLIFFGVLPTFISIYIFRKLFYSNQKTKKKENSKITGGHIESANKIIALKESESKNKGEKKKGKNKKNKKIEVDRESNIIKNEKTAVINKSIKTVIKTNDNKKERSETKTFGVIYINKDKQNIKIEKEKSKKDIPVINKIENKIIEKKEEIKEKKIEKEQEKDNNEIIQENNLVENKIQNNEDEENNINNEFTSGKNNNQILVNNNDVQNKNVNQLLNSNNNISNNINIKININLSRKSNSNNIDSPDIKEISENDKDKLIEANITQKKGENNNNYIYDIKINEEIGKETNSMKVSTTKNKVSKKPQNLKELLDEKKSKKKGTHMKKKSKKLEKEVQIPKIPEEKKEEEEIPKINEVKEDEKIEDEKSISNNEFVNKIENEILNENDNENENENEEDNKDDEENIEDFDLKIDIFNTDDKKEEKSEEEEVENEEEIDDDSYNIFNDPIFGSWYHNPFCTEEKKGDLDGLLKK